MIIGEKPNGYAVTYNADGRRIEFETRQCIHCQYTWSYGAPHQPEELQDLLGHPTLRGWCSRCNGWLCSRRSCIEQQLRLTRGTDRDCIPFEEWNKRILDKVGKYFPLDPDLTVTQQGVIVPRSTLSHG